MVTEYYRDERRSWVGMFLTAIALVVLGLGILIAGGAAALLPYWLLIMAVVAVVIVILVATMPAMALVGLLVLSYGMLPPYFTPTLALGGGRVTAADLSLVLLLVVCFVRSGSSMTARLSPARFPVWLLAFSLLLAAFLALRSKFGLGIPLKPMIQELRPILYWLVLPITLLAVDSRKSLGFLLIGMVIVAYALSIMVIVQSATGIRLLYVGQFTELFIVDDVEKGVLRTTTHGIYLILFVLLLQLALWMHNVKWSSALLPLTSILLAAIVFNFGRGLWVAALVGCLGVAALIRSRRAVWAAVMLPIAVGGGASLLVVTDTDIGHAIMKRATSIEAEVKKGHSLEWRRVENANAISALMRNPLLGIGVGADYRPNHGPFDDPEKRRYMHNSFLYLAVKFGLLMLLVPVGLLSWVWTTAYNALDSSKDPHVRSIVLAGVVTVSISGALLAFTQPEWMTHPTVTLMALICALIAVTPRILEPQR